MNIAFYVIFGIAFFMVGLYGLISWLEGDL